MGLLRLMFGAARTATFAQYEHPNYRQPGDRHREPEDTGSDPCPKPRCKGRIRKNDEGSRSCSQCGFIPPGKPR